MSDTTLRTKLIRLAFENPTLRDDLLPLIKEAGGFSDAGWQNYGQLGKRTEVAKVLKHLQVMLPQDLMIAKKGTAAYDAVVKKWKSKGGSTVDERGMKGKVINFKMKPLFIGKLGSDEVVLAHRGFKL